jgi:DNA uptake protein ComE-like DNA-binding protein
VIDTERKTKPSPDTEEERGKKATRINNLLDELKGHTKILLGPTIPDSKAPVFGGANSANFGTSMVCKPLTNVNREEGTDPTSSANPTYAALNERRDSPGGASYYIKGHLLNQQLGGKGIWDNLTPLSRVGNAQHERQVESVVKRTVDLPAIVEYSVTPAYAARGDKPALLTAISKSMDSAESKRVKSEIVKAEDSVPKSLAIEAHILDETLTRKDTVIKQSVNNEIARDYSSYHLLSSPKPIPVNLSEDDEKKLETLPGIGPILAKRIVQAQEERKKQGFKRFSSYKQIAELVTGIGEGKLEELEKAGHVTLY